MSYIGFICQIAEEKEKFTGIADSSLTARGQHESTLICCSIKIRSVTVYLTTLKFLAQISEALAAAED